MQNYYTAVYSYLMEEDGVEAIEMSRRKPVSELEADLLLDKLNEHGYIERIDSRDHGEFYDATDFDINSHQEIMEEFEF